MIVQDKKYFPMKEIMLLIGSVVVLIILSSFYVLCRIQSKNTKKIKTQIKNSQNFSQPAFYRYSAAESVDYLGNFQLSKLYNFVI
jgi:hypothetical protein